MERKPFRDSGMVHNPDCAESAKPHFFAVLPLVPVLPRALTKGDLQ